MDKEIVLHHESAFVFAMLSNIDKTVIKPLVWISLNSPVWPLLEYIVCAIMGTEHYYVSLYWIRVWIQFVNSSRVYSSAGSTGSLLSYGFFFLFCLLCNLIRTLEVICLHLAQSLLHHVTLKDSHYSNERLSADAQNMSKQANRRVNNLSNCKQNVHS